MTDLKSKAHKDIASSTINAFKRHLMPIHGSIALASKSWALPIVHVGIQTGGNTCFILSWKITFLLKLPLPGISYTFGPGMTQTLEVLHWADTELMSLQNHQNRPRHNQGLSGSRSKVGCTNCPNFIPMPIVLGAISIDSERRVQHVYFKTQIICSNPGFNWL